MITFFFFFFFFKMRKLRHRKVEITQLVNDRSSLVPNLMSTRFHIGSQIGDISVGDAKITSQAVSKDAGNIYNNTNSTMGTS